MMPLPSVHELWKYLHLPKLFGSDLHFSLRDSPFPFLGMKTPSSFGEKVWVQKTVVHGWAGCVF